MRTLRRFLFRLANPITRRRDESRLREEIEEHLRLQTAENMRIGMAPDEARRQAVLKFGAVEAFKERYRDQRGLPIVAQTLQDIRYALRSLRRNPGFAAVTILILALGIGATTAVFTVLNASVLSPLRVPNPDELVIVSPRLQGERHIIFNPVFEAIRESQRSLVGMFATSQQPFLRVVMEGETAPSYVRASLVSGDYFSVLELTPALGRLLSERDDVGGSGSCVAVISDSFWKRRFGGDRGALGRNFQVREISCAIVGVTPSSFSGHQAGTATDVWLPLRPLTDSKLLASRSMAFFGGVMGRLRPGVDISQAETELTSLYQRHSQDPSQPEQGRVRATDFGIRLIPGARGLERRQLQELLTLILGCAVAVLLIGTINVAILQVARGATRLRELETRAALGADRLRLLRQVAAEGTVIAGLGGVLGIALAWVVTPAIASVLVPGDVAAGFEMPLAQRVLGMAVMTTTLASLVGALLPAARVSRFNLQVGPASARTMTRPGQRLTRALVVAQFALALSLVTAMGLLLRTVVGLSTLDPGFRPDNVVVLDVRDERSGSSFGVADTPEAKSERGARYAVVEDRLKALPGVQAASLSWLGLFSQQDLLIGLIDRDAPNDRFEAHVDYVSASYFETVGMQIVQGRGFTSQDREGSRRVAVVNEALVRQRFGAVDGLGRQLAQDYKGEDRPFEVVGIVRDSKYNNLRETASRPMIWMPLLQAPFRITSVSLRVQPGMESAVVREAEQTMTSIDPYLMVRQAKTLSAQVSEHLSRERLLFKASWSLGGLALFLAAIGLFGTLAYGVTQRVREMGVRLALGAQSRTLLNMVLAEALRLGVIGLIVGIPLALVVGNSLRGFLFGVAPQDVVTLTGASLVLIVTAFLAAYLPARRASRVDPLTALRYE
jgi:predicted permease